jgi:arylformamidase
MFLSHFINSSTPAYGGESGLINITELNAIRNGDTSNSKRISIFNHIGTHIDFPRHFDDSGKTLSDYSSDFWRFDKIGFIESDIDFFLNKLEKIASNIEILILKTGFGQFRGTDKYWMSQPVIPSVYAKILREKFPNLRVFGFDLISLTSKVDKPEGKKAHKSFLIDYDILILEDMNLINLKTCPKNIIVAPLLISDIDGIQCTVLSF